MRYVVVEFSSEWILLSIEREKVILQSIIEDLTTISEYIIFSTVEK